MVCSLHTELESLPPDVKRHRIPSLRKFPVQLHLVLQHTAMNEASAWTELPQHLLGQTSLSVSSAWEHLNTVSQHCQASVEAQFKQDFHSAELLTLHEGFADCTCISPSLTLRGCVLHYQHVPYSRKLSSSLIFKDYFCLAFWFFPLSLSPANPSLE